MDDLVSSLNLANYQLILRMFRKHSVLQSILDVGCGKGEFVWAAIGQGYQVEGL